MKVFLHHFLILILTIIGLSSCLVSSKETRYVIGDDVSYLVLGSETTEQELKEIAAEFKSLQDIDVDFEGSIYDSQGRIVSVDLKVSTQNGSGTVSSSYQSGSAGFIVKDNSFRISSNLRLNHQFSWIL